MTCEELSGAPDALVDFHTGLDDAPGVLGVAAPVVALALRDADACVRLEPEWSKGHGRRGNALQGLRRYEEAKRSYERALELDPGCAKALYRRGEARCELRDAAGACADAKALLEVEPNGSAARALMRRAVALRRDEQQKESSAYRRMFGADSDSDD